MCGRFYVDDETALEIEKIVRRVDEKLKKEHPRGDIHPSEAAAVITNLSLNGEICRNADIKKWGFPGIGSQKLIFNARAESALEKKMFQDSIIKRRIVIPMTGFYEWNAQKEKVFFTGLKGHTMYLAGFYRRFDEEDRFVILTTAANESMKPVHDRMPLVLDKNEIDEWLNARQIPENILLKKPEELQKKMEYEQQSLLLP